MKKLDIAHFDKRADYKKSMVLSNDDKLELMHIMYEEYKSDIHL